MQVWGDTALDSKRGEGCCVRTERSGSQPEIRWLWWRGGWRNWPQMVKVIEAICVGSVWVCVCLGHKQSFGVRRGHWGCRGRGESSYLCTQLGFRPTCCLSHSLCLMEALTLQSINNAAWKLQVCPWIKMLGLGSEPFEKPFLYHHHHKHGLCSEPGVEFDALLFNVLLYSFPSLLFWVMTLLDFVCE